ncbi:HAMP domain-containing histidine kinase [Erythrobacter sp. JK5]|uniref:HAMP domain-containing histidine kinase n=1 Tax=Erythrobacter sp. JK5 TaxID=2829500 RepID=UPI001BA765C9|nr:HAMP domain-containing histidine kinase [Erythrobacter sp. JK5]QUL39168.1 HAMP domain-containing histidine kinase [Erythrobacter sp. JK5]
MFFDDRLATVLRQRGDSEAGARTQFRQLLDILGNRKYGRDHSLIAAAWLRMDALADRLPPHERAAMIREPGWRFRNADLAAHLADFEPEVASAALNRANLSAEDWTALIPRLPVRARGFLRLRKDLPVDVESLLNRLGVYDRGLPAPGVSEPAVLDLTEAIADEDQPANDRQEPVIDTVSPAREDPVESGRSEISALVERIAQFRRTRDAETADAELSPRLPLEDDAAPIDRRIAGFGFAADAAGRIEWADSEVAAMVIGIRLAAPRTLGEDVRRSALDRAFARRQPIVQAATQLSGASAIAGDWIVDAQPRFTEDGNFAGYVGRFLRQSAANDASASRAAREADRIRQLLHELRTPITAVQGYAEVIQQQLFGPAPHEYRALAAAIAADAAHILAGFEELDRLAKLETGVAEMEPGDVDLADLVARTVGQLAPVLAPRMAGIELLLEADGQARVAIDPDEAEALVWRLLATLGGGCASGEMLTCTLAVEGGVVRLACDLPAQLIGEESIFSAEARPVAGSVNAGPFGAGFTLRLARAEARAAGGSLVQDSDQVIVLLPLLTAAGGLPSDRGGCEAGGEA